MDMDTESIRDESYLELERRRLENMQHATGNIIASDNETATIIQETCATGATS